MKPATLALIAGGLFVAYKAFGRKPAPSSSDSGGVGTGVFVPQQEKPVQWNDQVKAQAKVLVDAQYAQMSAEEGFMLSPENMFVVTRDTAMEIWPDLSWPKTPNAASQMTEGVGAGGPPTERAWVVIAVNKGEPGHAMAIVWDKILTELVWPAFGYTPV